MNKNISIAIAVLLVLFAGFAVYFFMFKSAPASKNINSFSECVKAGYPVLESLPEQCKTPDGKTFINTAATPSVPLNMANPASVNCTKVGGNLTIVNEKNGQVGYCSLPSGKICEEWALYRGECK